MHVRSAGLILLAALLSACAVRTTPPVHRIALLAPFEGRYREIGYNALYAARLALADADDVTLELLPVDDGGTVASAVDRAEALALDPQVRAVVTLGYAATAAATQAAYADLPVVVAGHWSAEPTAEHVFLLAHPDLDAIVTAPPRLHVIYAPLLDTPLVGSEVLALEQFALLRRDLDGITVVSSGRLPDEIFADRYRASDPFAPEPTLLATLTYDATRLIIDAMDAAGSPTRAAVMERLAAHFDGGYWRDATINTFRFDESGQLTAVDNIVE